MAVDLNTSADRTSAEAESAAHKPAALKSYEMIGGLTGWRQRCSRLRRLSWSPLLFRH